MADGAADEALEACKQYMRVDGDHDDTLITSLMAAARLYLQGAGIEEPAENAWLYDMAVHALTLHYYDHRGEEGGDSPLPAGLRLAINQLKHSADGAL